MPTTNSAFWGDSYAPRGNNADRTQIERALRKPGMRKVKALLNALIGAAAGSNVTGTHKQVKAIIRDGVQFSVATIETVTDINRNTTAADVTDLKTLTTRSTRPSSYVVDKSGMSQGGYFWGPGK